MVMLKTTDFNNPEEVFRELESRGLNYKILRTEDYRELSVDFQDESENKMLDNINDFILFEKQMEFTYENISQIVCSFGGHKLKPLYVKKTDEQKIGIFTAPNGLITIQSNLEENIIITEFKVLLEEEQIKEVGTILYEGHIKNLPDKYIRYFDASVAVIERCNESKFRIYYEK